MLRSVPLYVLLADEVGCSVDIGHEPVAQGLGTARLQVEGQPAKPTASGPDPDASISQQSGFHDGRVLDCDGGVDG